MRRLIKISVIFAAVILSLTATLFTACGNKEKESALRGTFTYQDTEEVRVSRDMLDENDKEHLYNNVYPFMDPEYWDYNTDTDSYDKFVGFRIAYSMDQSLKLKRDYTYIYNYSISLKNPYEWGVEIAALSVNITGTFDFVDEGNGVYSVVLSNPTGGTQQVYGASIYGGNIYNWNKHSNPDLTLDYDSLSRNVNYNYDEYVKSHVVVVDKNERRLSDDIFFPQLLNYISNYSTY